MSGGAGAARGPQGSEGFSSLSPFYETRELKIAYGIQFHPGEFGFYSPVTPLQYLNDSLELSEFLEKVSDNEYVNHLQGVRFTIEETTSKQTFIEWLKTPEVHVIYAGHARYGRGPCFGARGKAILPPQLWPTNEPEFELVKTEDWEEGTDADSGLFRMGYPYIGVEASEVIEHGFTANPVKESEGRPARADCDPDLRGHLSSLRARPPHRILEGLDLQLLNHQDGDKYWSYDTSKGRAIVHHAGWRNTISDSSDFGTLHDPDDPDNTQILCRVFTHLGCSTFLHNCPVVRGIGMANWRHSDNERYAFWTSDTSAPLATVGPWLHAIISYNWWNAYFPWGPSLDWAVQRANRTLRADGWRYRLI
jgi:hypothetical protein